MKGLFKMRSYCAVLRFNEGTKWPLLFWNKYFTDPGKNFVKIYNDIEKKYFYNKEFK